MPYIKSYLRSNFEEAPVRAAGTKATVTGELNFVISTICRDYVKSNGGGYAAINDVIGALECAKLELYRRMAAPYEDTKITENGDVY